MESPPSHGVVTAEATLWTNRGAAPAMALPHRHDDLELNLVIRGRLDYLFGGTRVSVPAGHIALFWGATPHRLLDSSSEGDDGPGDICWVHIPLSTVLGWGLPDAEIGEVLLSRPIIVPIQTAARDVETMFEAWERELAYDDTRTIALLEVHALVRRLLHIEAEEPGHRIDRRPATTTDALRHVSEMAQFTVINFREPITPADITQAVHLNATYAMSLFRRAVGTTLGDYLTRCRVTEAQRLLVTTTMTASEIAVASGFGSQSSFYTHFTRACGVPPREYRARLR